MVGLLGPGAERFAIPPGLLAGGSGMAVAQPLLAGEPALPSPSPTMLGAAVGSLANRMVVDPLMAARNLGRAGVTGEAINPADLLALPVAQGAAGLLGAPRGALAMGGARQALPTQRQIVPSGPDRAIIREAARIDDQNMVETIFSASRPSRGEQPRVEIDFAIVDGFGRQMMVDRVPDVAPRAAMNALSTVERSVDNFVRQVRPRMVGFTAVREELIPLYRRVARRIAREHGGRAREPIEGRFEVRLPERTPQ